MNHLFLPVQKSRGGELPKVRSGISCQILSPNLLKYGSYDLETAAEQTTPSPKKRRGKSSPHKVPDLGQSSPATPHTLNSYGLTPEKANLLSKHGRKVKTFVPLGRAAFIEVLTLGREPTDQEFGEILGRNVERIVYFLSKINR